MANVSFTKELQGLKVNRQADVNRVATRIRANKARYEAVAQETNVPWYIIGVIHYRESNLDFSKHLHNGDPLTAKTVQVPRGRPKTGKAPFTWEESAIDAINHDKLTDTNWDSWDDSLDKLERFNGLGYRRKGVPSPYLWAGTSVYTQGKYVADGVYDSSVVDKQLGVVPIILALSRDPAETPRREIVEKSRKLTVLQRLRNAVVGTASSVMALDWLGMLSQVKQFATDHAGLLLVAGAGGVWIVFKIIEAYSIEDYKEGRYTPSGEAE